VCIFLEGVFNRTSDFVRYQVILMEEKIEELKMKLNIVVDLRQT